MKVVVWLFVSAVAAGLAYWFWNWRRRPKALVEASEARAATFMAQAMVAAKPPPTADAQALARQRLLLEAAAKAGEAGEPVLSIQLYARLLAKYPESSFAAQAKAAVETQKKDIAKA